MQTLHFHDRRAGHFFSDMPLAGNFGVWGLTFATCDCSLIHLRNREDHWNSIMAGAATGGILSIRSGPQAALVSAAIGGLLLGMIEAISIAMTRMSAEQFKPGLKLEIRANIFYSRKPIFCCASFKPCKMVFYNFRSE